MKLRSLFGLLLIMILTAMLGCNSGGGGDDTAVIPVGGGGGGGVQPTMATVKLSTQGALPAGITIGGIDATLNNSTNRGLSIMAANVTASGAGAGSTLAANTNTAGQVRMGLINANGIGTGEFATATFAIAAGNSPTAADFNLTPGTIIDLNGIMIPGVTVAIASVNIN